MKLCDLGLARETRSHPPYTEYVSTRWYRAPEIILRSTYYNSPVDIFALGCIFAELFLFKPLFPGTSQIDQIVKIVNVLGSFKQSWPEGTQLANKIGCSLPGSQKAVDLGSMIPGLDPEGVDLLQQMFRYESKSRITAQGILKHSYLSSVGEREEAMPTHQSTTSQKALNLPSDNYKLLEDDFDIDKFI